MVKSLKLKPEHWRAMRRYVSSQAPFEACGLLAGIGDSVECVLKVRNAAQSPVRYRMDAQGQLHAFEWIDAHGLELVGIFHSHPTGPETASPTDIAEAAYEVVHVIWSRMQRTWTARGFWIANGQVTEVGLQLLSEE